jgi:hypothetical protein
MWWLHRLAPSSHVYNVPRAFHVTGSLNIAALEKTLLEVVRRHEILRTTIETVDGEPLQVVGEPPDRLLLIADLRNLPNDDRMSEAMRLAMREALSPFDLTCGPLLRALLMQLDCDEQIIMLTIHHIASDGWSSAVLAQEIMKLYEAFSLWLASPLLDPPIQYADYAVWQRQRLQGEELEQHLSYWRRQLGGPIPVLELPVDRFRTSPIAGDCGAFSFTFPPALSKAVVQFSRPEGCTLFMFLLAIFKVLLYRNTCHQDLIVGSVVANRDRGGVENLLGCFVNTIAIRSDLSGNPPFRELLSRLKRVCLEAYVHQEIPLEMVMGSLRIERKPGYPPLFQALFVLQNAPEQALHLTGLSLSQLNLNITASKFPLTLLVGETAQGLSATFEYDASLFSDITVARLADQFQMVAEQVCANPDQNLNSISINRFEDDCQAIAQFNSDLR